MCNSYCLAFGAENLNQSEIKGKRVLEVGSYNVNGTLRGYCLSLEPKEYIGVDISEGNCVDRVVNAENLVKEFGKNSFDAVVSTEMLEHVVNWKPVIANMMQVTRPGGVILITTRSQGFPFHEYPVDAWRFEVSDMHKIFADFEREVITPDPYEPGVFVKVKKPLKWKPSSLELLDSIKLYSITAAAYV
jgi:SAM-dependent methyltransferase